MITIFTLLAKIKNKISSGDFWIQVATIIVIGLFLLAIVGLTLRGCQGDSEDDRFEQIQSLHKEHLKMVNNQIVEIERRQAIRDKQFDLLRDAYLKLDEEIHQSVEEREETYHELENALSIDDVDRILKSGISGRSGRPNKRQ
jgi:hypothetical protein